MHRRQVIRLAGSAVVGATLPIAAPHVVRAQANWPDKPVRIIVPFAAGGGTDLAGTSVRPQARKPKRTATR